MPPINETEAQRLARLNPTPGALQLPGGIFFDKEDPYKTTVYQKQPSGSYVAYDLGNLAREIAGSGTVDAQTGLGGQYKNPYEMGRALLAQQGIDLNQIPNTAFIDAGSLRRSGSVANGSFSQLKSALVAPPVASGTQAINTTPNTLGNIGTTNPLWKLQNETIDQYFARTNAMNPNYADKATPASTINASILGGGTPTNFTTSTPTVPTFNTARLPSDVSVPDVALTQPQTDLQKQINELMGLNTQEAGRAGYQNEQNAAFGVRELTRLQNDLSAQLKVSQLEAANIQATTQTGEGVTSAIDQRQRAEALRLNSVKSLQLYAQLEMAKGNLATAQDAADRAVQIKFDPIEADIKARTANINLILQSPEYTVAEKNQAAKIKATLDAQTRAIQEQKDIITRNNSLKTDVLNAAQTSGDNTLAAKIIQLNPESPTFQADLASLQGQIKPDQLQQLQIQKAQRDLEGGGTGGAGVVKPLTSTQSLALGYGERLLQSSLVIDEVGGQFTGFISRLVGAVPVGLRTQDRQRFEQAKRNFINAVLRRESGAAIAPSEFESADLQYFPQPGDKEDVLIQKKQNRDLVIKNFLREGGVDTSAQDSSLSDPLGIGLGDVFSNPLNI